MFLVFQLWDIRKKASIHTFQNTYQVLSVTFNDTSDQIISGGIDNDIKVERPCVTDMLTHCLGLCFSVGLLFSCVCLLQVWDLRQNKLIYSMQGHGDSVTGLSLSSEGSYLLSNSMDNSGERLNLVCEGERCRSRA